jgi:cytochrome c-type biogenesis protein CcmF
VGDVLSLWTVAVTVFSRHLPEALVARVLGVLGLVSVGFLPSLLVTPTRSTACCRRAEGRDLNPLLQDPGMIIHPPLLYMGYVGFSVAFAFAIAALLVGPLDAAWARWSRPWTTVAWVFLTAASRSARAGPITSWAGAAGGSGIRSRTPPSCPGCSARR